MKHSQKSHAYVHDIRIHGVDKEKFEIVIEKHSEGVETLDVKRPTNYNPDDYNRKRICIEEVRAKIYRNDCNSFKLGFNEY